MHSRLFLDDTVTATAGGPYIEDVFSTYLYTGTGSALTISNAINLTGNDGMVWLKSRSDAVDHALYDTLRGATKELISNTTAAQTTQSTGLTAFNSDGFSIGTLAKLNTASSTYVSWTFRKSTKFFDIVTYTGTGSANTIAHNLGIAPGCIIVKRTDTTSNWAVYHRGNTSAAYYEKLNLIDAQANDSTVWNSTAPTASVFSVGTSTATNASGGTYVAYLFAHDATSSGLVQCGSFTTDASGAATISLGWEPQWVLIKQSSAASAWFTFDTMRGMSVAGNSLSLAPSAAAAEANQGAGTVYPTATGFVLGPGFVNPSGTFVYIAIRRGPMKTPTVGTSVFAPATYTTSGPRTVTSGFPVDLTMQTIKAASNNTNTTVVDKLRGGNQRLISSANFVEGSGIGCSFSSNTSYIDGVGASNYWMFSRAPSFFDEVCYTGTGSNRTLNHNLGAIPELMLVKGRSGATNWQVYSSGIANTEYLVLNSNVAKATDATVWNSTTPSTTTFAVGTAANVNTSGATYVAYLFASCPGVSKVGSYTGNGTSQTINCGFSNGARFFLVKRTDSTGDWWAWDSARGIIAASEPAIALNSNAPEVAGSDAVDPDNSGIIVNQETTFNINVNGGTYIYLAIA